MQDKPLSQLIGSWFSGPKTELDLSNKSAMACHFWEKESTASFGAFSQLLDYLERRAGDLQHIRKVALRLNQLSAIPPFVFKLFNLKVLDLTRNDLSEIPREIGQLLYLERLLLGWNDFSEFPGSILSLKNLRELQLVQNPLKDLPAQISNLPRLETLTLVRTEIETIPGQVILMPSLSRLDFRNTPVRGLGEVDIEEIPRSVLSQGIGALRTHLRDEKPGLCVPREVKMMIVGDGEVGKTTLFHNLLKPDLGTGVRFKRTHGLQLESWYMPGNDNESSQIKVNIWDFGGQGVYREVQQLFFTPFTLYLYLTVPDTVKYREDKYLDLYWLSMINTFGRDPESGDEGHSPILYVMNQVDKDPEGAFIDEGRIKKMFPNIKNFHKVSCLENEGLAELKRMIYENIRRLDALKMTWPPQWIEIRTELARRKSEPVISKEEFVRICHHHGVTEDTDTRNLLKMLNATGAVLHFEGVLGLRHKIVLDPEWVKEAAYKVLGYPPAIDSGGTFSAHDFEKIWPDNPAEDHDQLIKLMEDFEICYTEKEGGKLTYVVPSLFPLEPDPGYRFEHLANPRFAIVTITYRYVPLIPPGILSKFMLKNHVAIHENIKARWRSGIAMAIGDTLFELEERWRENSIRVKLCGPETQTIYEHYVHRPLQSIHKHSRPGSADLSFSEWVECPCSGCNGSDTPHEYPYRQILQDAPDQINCPKHFQPVQKSTLLQGTLEDNHGSRISRSKPTVFISYSSKDDERAMDLLKRLEAEGIEVWIDEKSIETGSPLDDAIRDFIIDCDYTVVLISKNSLKSNWVNQEIVQTLQTERVQRRRKLLPILFDKNFLEDDFQIELVGRVSQELRELSEKIMRLDGMASDSQNLNQKKSRLHKYKANLDQVFNYLNNTNVKPAEGENWDACIAELVRIIKGGTSR